VADGDEAGDSVSNAGDATVLRRPSRLPSAADILPTLLLLLAEGGWIAVAYILFEAASREAPLLPPVPMALLLAAATGAGVIAERMGPRRTGRGWPIAAIVLVALVALVGWALAGQTRAALVSPSPLSALNRHPGGWLLGLAFFRGTGLARSRSFEAPGESPVAVGIPAIVAAYLVGGVIGQPGRGVFMETALPDAILCVCAGLVGLSLTRARAIGAGGPLDWRRNPAWLGTLLAISVAILAVALPASFTVGPALLLVLAALPVPLLFVGLLFGIDRRIVRILIFTFALAIVMALILRSLIASGLITMSPVGRAGVSSQTDETWHTMLAAFLLAAFAVFLVALAIATWMRKAPSPSKYGVDEERVIERDDEASWRLWRRPHIGGLRHRGAAPRDAAEAYLASVAALERVEWLRRDPTETPAEHARRVRVALGGHPFDDLHLGRIGSALGRLAADYELARFGARPLTRREDRRGLERFAEIHRAIGRMRRSMQRRDAARSSEPRPARSRGALRRP
jgi:hypothetical protein